MPGFLMLVIHSPPPTLEVATCHHFDKNGGFSFRWWECNRVSMEVSNWLVSWFITYGIYNLLTKGLRHPATTYFLKNQLGLSKKEGFV